jgi:hypothetical protein
VWLEYFSDIKPTVRKAIQSFVHFLLAAIALTALSLTTYVTPARAQFPAACDKDKQCVGNAIAISITTGKGAQYVDIDTSSRFWLTDTALTFEAWIKPEPQPGKIQYVAGLWGPNKDNNDSWVVYLQDSRIVFALSMADSYKGDSDNTIASTTIPDLYTSGWRHLAVEWDAVTTEARIYLDGVRVATATNPLYPLTKLHRPENRLLPLQLASTNALYDDTVTHRTFKGMIDEVRLWSRALSAVEIQCQKSLSLAGNERGLEMYFRCNEAPFVQSLCDATGQDHVGRLRSGATCDTSDRTMPPTYTITPSFVNTRLVCTQDTTFTFTITDTSFCGSNVSLALYGDDAGLFSLPKTNYNLVQGVPQTIGVRMHATAVGRIQAGLQIANANRCGDPINIPLTIDRVTELSYTAGKLMLDTIYVGCKDQTFSERSVTICNPTRRTITVSSIGLDSNHFTLSVTPAISFPHRIAPGECITITLRMGLIDSTHTFYDTLRVASDEACLGSGILAISGTVQDVLGLLLPDGKTRLTAMAFETVCPGMISNSQTYQFRSLGSDTVRLDSIVYTSANFFGQRFGFPMDLLPRTAYLPTFVRFRPDQPGPFNGSIVFHATYRGCNLEKTVTLTGRGFSVDVDFLVSSLNFGSITVGKIGNQIATVKDNGTDPRTMSAYLKVGDVFTITGGKSFGIAPGQTQDISLAFRPREPKTYYDTLCIFDQGCYETNCIPIEGTGFFEAFSFDPPFLELPNVVGCQSKKGTITVTNISGAPVTVSSCVLSDPSGKFAVQSLLPNGVMTAGQTFAFTVTYTPNDLAQDRADDAYIDITLSDGQVYHMLLRASSVAPRVYITPLTANGTVEVGWQKQEKILIENASATYQRLTAISLPYGYRLVSTVPTLPTALAPRDSLWATVEFKPTGDSDYNGDLRVTIDSPCVQEYAGALTGRGSIVKLQVPVSFINYGIVKPCDCQVREIPLSNYSNLIALTVDSVWIDGTGVTPLVPSTFSWIRKSTGTASLPFDLAPQSADTLVVSFCPNIPATKANQVKNDTLHIAAHAPGWSSVFRTMLSGRRELNFQPNTTLVNFPATRVDTSAQPQAVTLTVPDVLVNPSGDSVVITSVSFHPDQQVFSASASTGEPLPWIVRRNEKFSIKVGFNPRQPKSYTARMYIHTSYPCNSDDTTVLVMGSGFAPAFGLQFAFDTARVGRDTLRLTTCDTLVLPIFSSRAIPQKYIDMFLHLGFDTSSFEYLDASSPYTNQVSGTDTSDGVSLHLTDAIDAQAGPVATVLLRVKGGPNAFPITLDNVYFDSDSLVFFKIISGIDHAYVIIDEPMIAMTKWTDFDTVNIKSCKDDTVTVYNPGAIPIRFDSLGGLPRWHQVTGSSVPLPATIAPGDSITLTVTFCPRDEVAFDTTLASWSNAPCPILDTGRMHSFGYAPPFPFTMSIGTIAIADTIGGRIADTITVPILIDRDIPQTPLDVPFVLEYNHRALEYISISSKYTTPTASDAATELTVHLPECQDLKAGEIARVKFVIAVPDSVTSVMTLTPGTFTSDSIFWVKPMAAGDSTTVSVGSRCNISRLVFRAGNNSVSRPQPNPSSGKVSLDVEFVEDANPVLAIYDESGACVRSLLDGTRPMQGGKYHLEFDTRALPSGVYHLEFRAASFREVERLVIVH